MLYISPSKGRIFGVKVVAGVWGLGTRVWDLGTRVSGLVF